MSLLYFLMLYLLQGSSAELTVCKTIPSLDNDAESLFEDHHQCLIFINQNNIEKSHIDQINLTEINKLKHKITGWLV